MPQALIDITGKKFGWLTVVGLSKKRKGTKPLWECRCKCGCTTYAQGSHLRSGLKTSCGCARAQAAAANGDLAADAIRAEHEKHAVKTDGRKEWLSLGKALGVLGVSKKMLYLWTPKCPYLPAKKGRGNRGIKTRSFEGAFGVTADYYLRDDIDELRERRANLQTSADRDGYHRREDAAKELGIRMDGLRARCRRTNIKPAKERIKSSDGHAHYRDHFTEAQLDQLRPTLNPDHLTYIEAADLLNCKPVTVNKYIREGLLRWDSTRGKGEHFLARADVESLAAELLRNPRVAGHKWIDSRKRTTGPPAPVLPDRTPTPPGSPDKPAVPRATLEALGIALDERKKTISIPGKNPIEFGRSEVEWHILIVALSAFPVPYTLAALLAEYPGDKGRAPRANAKLRLNRALRKIGLQIDPAGLIGKITR